VAYAPPPVSCTETEVSPSGSHQSCAQSLASASTPEKQFRRLSDGPKDQLFGRFRKLVVGWQRVREVMQIATAERQQHSCPLPVQEMHLCDHVAAPSKHPFEPVGVAGFALRDKVRPLGSR
jgi:hypothetical protein